MSHWTCTPKGVGFGSTALPKPVSPTESLQQRYATSATENLSLMHAAHHDDISLGLPSLHFFRQRAGWVLFTTAPSLGKGSSIEVNAPVFPSLPAQIKSVVSVMDHVILHAGTFSV